MDSTTLVLICIFAICLSGVIFAYAGYPAVIWLCAKVFGRSNKSPTQIDELPTVSLLIAAHNEEADIAARIENALKLDYPREKLQIVIASDGSTDATVEIARRYALNGVQVFDYQENRGKVTVLNRTVPRLNGELVVLSDANTHMAADAVRKLVAWFQDPSVGVVCGKLVLTDPRTGTNADSLYWKYETFLKKCESKLGALLGSNGAIYAIRKDLYPEAKPGTLIDDFVIPLEAKRRSGCRIVYDMEAIAYEETPPSIQAEFRRRVRIGAGGFQSIGLLWPLLNPRHGWVAGAFLFHKVLRWVCPFLLIGVAATNAILVSEPKFGWLMLAQILFYVMAMIAMLVPGTPKAFRLPAMFVSMNVALFFGFFRYLKLTFTGNHSGTWGRTERTAPAPALVDLVVVSDGTPERAPAVEFGQ